MSVQTVICVAFNNSSLRYEGVVLVEDGTSFLIGELLRDKYQVLEVGEIALPTLIAIVTAEFAKAVKLKFDHYTYKRVDYEAALRYLAEKVLSS